MGAGFETTVKPNRQWCRPISQAPRTIGPAARPSPELWSNAVEEVLRIDAPVQTTARIALSDCALEGVELPQGATIVPLAGRSEPWTPAVFTDPDVFDVARPNAKDHLTFSTGIPRPALGASLARMEASYAPARTVRALPRPATGRPAATPENCSPLHGYERMPVRLGRRAPDPGRFGGLVSDQRAADGVAVIAY